MMYGGGTGAIGIHDNTGTFGYATLISSTTASPWHLFPYHGADGKVVPPGGTVPPGGDGRIVGVCGFFLPGNYKNARSWPGTHAKDFVVLYCRAQVVDATTGDISGGGMFVGVGRFPRVPRCDFTRNDALRTKMIVHFESVAWDDNTTATGGQDRARFTSQGHTRFAVGSLGVNENGRPDGARGWIYACEPQGNVWRSPDYGRTWSMIPGAPAVASAPAKPYTNSLVDATGCLAQDSSRLDRLIYQSVDGPVRIDDAKAAAPSIVEIYKGTDDVHEPVGWGQAGPLACANYSNDKRPDEVFVLRNAAAATKNQPYVPTSAWYSTNAFTAQADQVVWQRQDDPSLESCLTVANDMQLTSDGFGQRRALISSTVGGYKVARIASHGGCRRV